MSGQLFKFSNNCYRLVTRNKKNMKKKTKSTFCRFLLGFATILLFTFASCGIEELPLGVAKIDQKFISEAKSFVEVEMNKNQDNAFLTSFPLAPDWKHAVVDNKGTIRVSMLHNQSAKDVFELFITKESGSLAGVIIQFMPYEKLGKTKFHRILFSLNGNRKTDLLVPASFLKDLQNLNGKAKLGAKNVAQKTVSTTPEEPFAYLCDFFIDSNGNPADLVTLQFCPDGLLFNSELQVCDWPEEAGVNATRSFFSIIFLNSNEFLNINISTYGYLEELEEVIVQNTYHNPTIPSDNSSSFWVSFPPNFSYPTYPIETGGGSGGGSGGDYYPIGELPVVTTKAQELKAQLSLNTNQYNWVKARSAIASSLFDYMFMNYFSRESEIFALEMINQMILDQSLTFEQASTITIVNNLSNPITGDPIEFYLLAQYKNSNTLKLSSFSIDSNSIQVGTYTITPHYKSNGTLVFYTAVRWNSTGNGLMHDIEFIIKPSGLANFQQKIDLYTNSANLFYLNGTPSQGQIAMAAGDYVNGLKDRWADALSNPMYYVYLGHVFVGVATNLNAVESTSTTFEGKIKFTSTTSSSSSDISIDINNRSYTQYRQMIQDKYPNLSWTPNASGEVDLFIPGNIKYVGRFQNSSGYAYVIEYWRNGQLIGKFRFFY